MGRGDVVGGSIHQLSPRCPWPSTGGEGAALSVDGRGEQEFPDLLPAHHPLESEPRRGWGRGEEDGCAAKRSKWRGVSSIRWSVVEHALVAQNTMLARRDEGENARAPGIFGRERRRHLHGPAGD